MKKYVLAAVTAVIMSVSANSFAAEADQVAALPSKQERTVMRPDAIHQALNDQGYSQVRKLRYWNGVYQAKALRAGKGWVTVMVNPASGRSITVN